MFCSSEEKSRKQDEDAQDCSILFLTENMKYQEALHLIKLTKFDKTPEILIATAACYIGVNNYNKALEVIGHAEMKGWILPDILSMKGRILFRLNEFELAQASFEQYERIYSKNKYISLWIMRCKARLQMESDPLSVRTIKIDKPLTSVDVRSDWYQNSTTVSMTLFIIHLTEDQVKIVFKEKSVDVTVDAATCYQQTFHLLREIIPNESKFEITPCKIEIKMKKATVGNWKTLESKT